MAAVTLAKCSASRCRFETAPTAGPKVGRCGLRFRIDNHYASCDLRGEPVWYADCLRYKTMNKLAILGVALLAVYAAPSECLDLSELRQSGVLRVIVAADEQPERYNGDNAVASG